MATITTNRRRGVNASAAIKVPCIAASTGNLTLSGEQTVDGIALVEDDRCFAKDQTDATEIGIYAVSTGTWTREPDFDGAYDVVEGTIVPVSRGTANADTYWKITNTGDIDIGTTALTVQATTVLDSAILNDGSVKMIADFSPQVTDTYDLGTKSLRWVDGIFSGDVVLAERSDHSVTPAAGYGSVWSKNDAPNLLIFTDDAGTDHRISPPAVVANHTRVGNMYRVNTDTDRGNFQPDVSVTIDTWESVGPTGSGADNIFTAMDVIPANAKFMIVFAYAQVTSNAAGNCSIRMNVAEGDIVTPSLDYAKTAIVNLLHDADASGEVAGYTTEIYIPLGATNLDWQVNWTTTNASADNLSLYYQGFIIDNTP